MRVTSIHSYSGHVDPDGLVAVFDITVARNNYYYANGVLVHNSKRISLLDVNALMAMGAVENLRDAGAIRGQRNEGLWLQFMQGHMPRHFKVPLVYEKFINQLRAGGIHVVRQGHKTNIMA